MSRKLPSIYRKGNLPFVPAMTPLRFLPRPKKERAEIVGRDSVLDVRLYRISELQVLIGLVTDLCAEIGTVETTPAGAAASSSDMNPSDERPTHAAATPADSDNARPRRRGRPPRNRAGQHLRPALIAADRQEDLRRSGETDPADSREGNEA